MSEHDARPTPGWRAATAALVVTAATNVTLLVAGATAGASFTVPGPGQDGAVLQIGLGAVLLSTVLPLGAGLAGTALVARRWPRARGVLQVLAVVVTLASLTAPLSAQTDSGTRVLLSVMHLVVGCAYVVAVRAQRPRPATGHLAPTSTPERVL